MGNKPNEKVHVATFPAKERMRENLPKAKSITDLPVDKELKHALPFPVIKSRLSSAIIMSYMYTRKKVVMRVIVINRSCRAYIITQEGLPGFLIPRYQNLASLLSSELLISLKLESSSWDDFP